MGSHESVVRKACDFHYRVEVTEDETVTANLPEPVAFETIHAAGIDCHAIRCLPSVGNAAHGLQLSRLATLSSHVVLTGRFAPRSNNRGLACARRSLFSSSRNSRFLVLTVRVFRGLVRLAHSASLLLLAGHSVPRSQFRGLTFFGLAIPAFMPTHSLPSSMSEAESTRAGRQEVWIEKYRPQTLEDIAGHEAIVERLGSYVSRNDLSHMLFAGPAGVGKTTAATAIARELYGDDWEENFLELNASDERGIDVVRDRVKSFARTSFGGYDYRIIFLDEADALTADAQSALRRTMEQFSNNVRFILSCNYSSQIIDPIQSRCAVFRFSPLSDEAVEAQVRQIASEEVIDVTEDGIEALVYVAGGDMRKAINGLQAASMSGDTVDEEAVFEITSTARPEDIREMVDLALDGDFTAARSRLDTLLTEEGIAGGDIIDQLHRTVWEFDLSDAAAVRVLDRVGEADYRITEGASERIQLEALLASLALDGRE